MATELGCAWLGGYALVRCGVLPRSAQTDMRALDQKDVVRLLRSEVNRAVSSSCQTSCSRRDHIGGVTPSRPTRHARPCSVPSGCLIAAMKTFAPGLRSLLSPFKYATIGVSAGTK